MNSKKKFENFLEGLKGKGQDTLIESVKSGFQACFEFGYDSEDVFDDLDIMANELNNMIRNDEQNKRAADMDDYSREKAMNRMRETLSNNGYVAVTDVNDERERWVPET